MRRLVIVPAFGLAAVLAACGQTTEQKAATGGLGGMAAGAAVGGPVGAAVGAGVGAAGGAYGEQAVEEAREATQSQTQMEQSAAAQPARMSREEIRQAQRVLQERGYYRGQIDGIVGPRTREAVAQYQRRQGLPQTAQLDGRTVDSLMQEQAGLPEEGGAQRQQR